ncbi:uncharacterized protein SPSK_01333 [Sporothrix schenckii 1099-18]|uniref:Uncharacterized protein n=1 Tax=Sporothrix schenckii 1099-18 TaxID=1397361 RepID=A0A0F2LWZ7_SPOSC|nr:uncharacterized protein SPSK_01333 [Sporothrix schenckii 1099-18]KJR81379.1 hypothetical protein SPSK_01333 [Sporothrix schenckii 1099-18]
MPEERSEDEGPKVRYEEDRPDRGWLRGLAAGLASSGRPGYNGDSEFVRARREFARSEKRGVWEAKQKKTEKRVQWRDEDVESQ